MHRSLLNDQSGVFASVVELPQGTEGLQTDLYGGLPLVRLPDTSAVVFVLLNALRDPMCFYMSHSLGEVITFAFLKETL